jgi:hypothetical protein
MKIIAPLAAAGLCVAANLAVAGPADYIYTPAVERGELEIDFKAGHERPGAGGSIRTDSSIGIGYGINDWWFTEVYAKYKRQQPDSTRYDALEWENKFQLLETGKYPVDLGLLFEIERPTDRTEGYEIKWGPLLQADFGKWQLNGNLLFERNHRNLVPGPTKLLHQAQVKYRWKPELEFGIQSFGEVGQWNAWMPRQARDHRIGPALFGKIALGNHDAIKYNFAILAGTTAASPDRTFRLQTEYEF